MSLRKLPFDQVSKAGKSTLKSRKAFFVTKNRLGGVRSLSLTAGRVVDVKN